jgi:ABC-2 type transport system ATP-binding protein
MVTLEALPGINQALLFGRHLHVVTGGAEAAMPVMAAALAAAGFSVDGMERIVPSLEDVFVSLIEARDRQAMPQEAFRR